MPLMKAQCTNCGAALEVDNAKEAAICPYCGTPYIVEKAINNYNTVNNISAGVVNIYGGNVSDFEIRGGVLEKYCGASTVVVIPDTVKAIGAKDSTEGAFRGCAGITSVTIPDSVTYIGNYAFQGCSSLESIVIPDGVTYVGEGAFDGCTALTSVSIPAKVIHIGWYAFRGCTSLKSTVTIPGSVTSIGHNAFEGCTCLESVTISDGVTAIGLGAFEGCTSLTSVVMPHHMNSAKILTNTFRGCSSLKSVTIPDGITSIERYAFEGCTSLTSVSIPGSVTTIELNAFEGCTCLESVTIPNSVNAIYDGAFAGCTRLESVTIPDGVTHVGEGAFDGCPALTEINASKEWKNRHYSAHESLKKYKPKSKGGCYVATAVYGSYDCPQVWTLRRFRDHTLAKTWFGRAFIRFYYAVSPTLVKWFGGTGWFKGICRPLLDKLVKSLKEDGVSDTPYSDRTW